MSDTPYHKKSGRGVRQDAPYYLRLLPVLSIGNMEPLHLVKACAPPPYYTPLQTYKDDWPMFPDKEE